MPDCRMIVFRPLSWRRRLLRRVARAWADPDEGYFWTCVALIVALACAAVIGIAALLQPVQAAGGWPR